MFTVQNASAKASKYSVASNAGVLQKRGASQKMLKKSKASQKTGVSPLLIILYCSAFIAAYCENMMSIALVSIMGDFSISTASAQWLVTGYMIVTAIITTVTAFLFQGMRLKTLFILAAGIIIGTSCVCYIAPSYPILLASRLVQALGSGIFIPTMMSAVMIVAPEKSKGTYLSVGNCMITLGPALGPVFSGLSVSMFGWRSVFLFPLIIMVVILVVGLFIVKDTHEPKHVKIDALSLVLSALGLFPFVYGLSILTSDTVLALALIVIGALILAVFARRQFKLEVPLLDLRPLRNLRFTIACVLVVVGMILCFSMSVLVPLYYEEALSMSAIVAGGFVLIPALTNSCAALIGGRTIDKHGVWPLLPIGFGLIVIGQIVTSLLATQLMLIFVLVGSILMYAGIGLVFAPSQTSGLQALPPVLHPHGVSIINVLLQVAASVGSSLLVGILSDVAANAVSSGTDAALAQAQGFSAAVGVSVGVALLGFVLAIWFAHKAKDVSNKN